MKSLSKVPKEVADPRILHKFKINRQLLVPRAVQLRCKLLTDTSLDIQKVIARQHKETRERESVGAYYRHKLPKTRGILGHALKCKFFQNTWGAKREVA